MDDIIEQYADIIVSLAGGIAALAIAAAGYFHFTDILGAFMSSLLYR